MPTNYIVQNIIEKMKNTDDGPRCHDCVAKVPAMKHCKTCVLNLCNRCSEYHQGCVRFVGHKLIDISKAPQQSFASQRYCSKHAELLKYFCGNCKVLVCNDCMVSAQHKQHDISLESEVKEKKMSEIKQKLENIQVLSSKLSEYKKEGEAFKARIEKEDEKSIKLVKQVFQEIRVELAEKEKETIERVKTKSNIDSFNEFTVALKKIADTVDYVKSLINDQKCIDLEIANELDLQLDQLSKNYQFPENYHHGLFDHHFQQNSKRGARPPTRQFATKSITQANNQVYQRQNGFFTSQYLALSKNLGMLNFQMNSTTIEVNPSRNHQISQIVNNNFSDMIPN